jgi:hypothetical protein
VDKSSSAKKELIVKIELFVILPGLGVDRKCRHGSLPAARRAIPENICSSRAFLRLTRSGRHLLDWATSERRSVSDGVSPNCSRYLTASVYAAM